MSTEARAGSGVRAASAWPPVLAYAALGAANQMLWLTYAPVTTGAARHFGVSEGAVGWLAELFPLLYVVLAVPAGRLVDRDLGRWLAVGALLTAAGAVVRLADGYAAVLAGQLLVAVAQPLVLNAVIPVSARYLRAADRPNGLAVSSAGVFAGMLLALLLGAVFGAGGLRALVAVQAVLAVLAAAALVGALARTRAPSAGDAAAAAAAGGLRTVWADPGVRVLVGLVSLGFGVFVALTTWLQALLDPAGVSESGAGVLLLLMVVAGVAGSALLPPWLHRHGRERAFVLVSVLAGVAGMAVLAAAPGLVTGAVVMVVVGALLLTDLPVVLELVERRAGAAGGTASGLVWLAGNAAGLVVALAVQVLVHRPALAFALLAVLLAAGVPLVARLRP